MDQLECCAHVWTKGSIYGNYLSVCAVPLDGPVAFCRARWTNPEPLLPAPTEAWEDCNLATVNLLDECTDHNVPSFFCLSPDKCCNY